MAKAKTAQDKAEQEIGSPKAKLKPQWRTSALRSDNFTATTTCRSARSRRKKFEADLIQASAFSEGWRQFQLANGTQDQIREKLNAYKDVSNQRAQFLAENGILLSQIEKQGVELARYTGAPVKVALPRTPLGRGHCRGCTIRFCGAEYRRKPGCPRTRRTAREPGRKTIGKLRILDVKKDHSIANILPGWKQEEIQTGDLVIVGN
ncbi:MAG: hypothetical protein CM1200mP29_17650 [Verrucomicrobiota bacterium]|nr:MAG: hypothetical protein CM1200mP29_17650 [Verrucomicrobiota bacterium]